MTIVTILVPSLARPHQLDRVLANIDSVTRDHRILAAVSDESSAKVCSDNGVEYLFDCVCGYTDCDCDVRYVTRMNKLFRLVVTPYVFFGQDDVTFHDGWLDAALAQGCPVTIVNDGVNPVGTAALVATDFIIEHGTRFDGVRGVPFFEGYHHNFADTEMFTVTDDVIGRAHRSLVTHDQGRPMDATYALQADHYMEDQLLFNTRREQWRTTE